MKQKKQVGENKTEGKKGGRGASQTEFRLWRKKQAVLTGKARRKFLKTLL